MKLKPTVYIFLFALLLCGGLLRHELWGDELQAWMLARSSSSIGELLQNTVYEGHPILWHLLLWWVTRFSHDPIYMQLLQWFIAVGTACIISFWAPFRKAQKILLIFSYFIFYEYAVISRGYGLGVFLTFLFCILSEQRCGQNEEAPVPPSDFNILMRILVLVALANTSAYGLILSFSLSLIFWKRLLGSWAVSRRKHLVFLNSCLLGGWILSGWQIVRAFQLESMRQIIKTDSFELQESFRQTVHSASEFSQASLSFNAEHLSRVSRLVTYVWKGYIPIPQLDDLAFWNTSLFSENAIGLLSIPVPGLGGVNLAQLLAVLLSIFLLGYIPLYCLYRPSVKISYCLGNALLLLLTYLTMPTAMRHYGHFFILLIACAWLDAVPSTRAAEIKGAHVLRRTFQQRIRFLLVFILFIQSCVGAYAFTLDLLYPFSGSRNAIQLIRQQELEELPIVASPPWPTAVFPGYLDKEVYYFDLQKYGSFVTPLRGDEDYVAAIAEVRRLLKEKGEIVVVMDLNQDLEARLADALRNEESDTQPLNFKVKFLGKFEGELEASNSYLLYTFKLE